MRARSDSSKPRWQIESGTRGIYVGSKYAEQTTNWPLFSWSPSEDRIIQFNDKGEAEAELARGQSWAANARLHEVGWKLVFASSAVPA